MRRGPILDDLGHVAETAGWSATVGVPHRLGSRYFAVTRWLPGFSDHAFTDRVRAVRRCDAGVDNRLLALCSPREQNESQRTRNEDGERGRERPRFDEERCEGGEGSRGGNGEDPRPDDAPSDAPSHGAEPPRRAGAHNRSGYYVRRADG